MKKTLSISFLFLACIAYSQDKNSDYIVNLDVDTTYCSIEIKSTRKIITTIKNQENKYSPEDILGFQIGNKYYEAGRFSIPAKYGARSWSFEQRLVAGEMSLFVMYTGNSTTNEVTQQTTSSNIATFHVKLNSGARDDYMVLSMGWKKKLAKLNNGCAAFDTKMDGVSNADYNDEFLTELVTIFNNCQN